MEVSPVTDAEQPFDEWLSERIEKARETYQDGPRSENSRRTDIALGKIRALKDARPEYLNQTSDQNDG
jgi:hypothetical protein